MISCAVAPLSAMATDPALRSPCMAHFFGRPAASHQSRNLFPIPFVENGFRHRNACRPGPKANSAGATNLLPQTKGNVAARLKLGLVFMKGGIRLFLTGAKLNRSSNQNGIREWVLKHKKTQAVACVSMWCNRMLVNGSTANFERVQHRIVTQ